MATKWMFPLIAITCQPFFAWCCKHEAKRMAILLPKRSSLPASHEIR
ncbi:hypothetical protein EVA_11628 [gut metagenome]|uniref:Uncharacterized protein n=1 Tax=gut metagenome TaxID=749906 RepID=J9G0A4_9ZZZZ